MNVLLIYGGQSTEHDISCRSASFVIQNLNQKKYHLDLIGVDKKGCWYEQDKNILLKEMAEKKFPSVHQDKNKILFEPQTNIHPSFNNFFSTKNTSVIFNVIHGTGGEDGSLQGFLETLNIPYVGADVYGSSLGMDKIFAKKVIAYENILTSDFVDFDAIDWNLNSKVWVEKIKNKLRLPVFVKPSRQGSSMGVSKVKTWETLHQAIENALQLDERILVENGIDAREIEVAMLGGLSGKEPRASLPGEITYNQEFYTFDAKYIDQNASEAHIPAQLSPELIKEFQKISRQVFKFLGMSGLARVDFLLEKKSNKIYFNEINSLPGMTPSSFYPLLWQESGIPPEKLLDELIQLGLEKWQAKNKIRSHFFSHP